MTEIRKDETGKVVEVIADTVVTDPNSPEAVQVLPAPPHQFDQHGEEPPVSDPTGGGLLAVGDKAGAPQPGDGNPVIAADTIREESAKADAGEKKSK